MKDVADVLKQGMQVKLTHRVDTQLGPVTEGYFGINLVNGAITGIYTKGEKDILKYYPIATFKIELAE
jgi:hypothetical protein